MLDKEVLQRWAEEAARGDDPVLAALLTQLAELRGCSDHWSIEMLKRIADLKVNEASAGGKLAEDDWPDLLEG